MTEFTIEGKTCSGDECRAAVAAVLSSSDFDLCTISRSDGFSLTVSDNSVCIFVLLATPDGGAWSTDVEYIPNDAAENPVSDIVEAFLASDFEKLDTYNWDKAALNDKEASRVNRWLALCVVLFIPVVILIDKAVEYLVSGMTP